MRPLDLALNPRLREVHAADEGLAGQKRFDFRPAQTCGNWGTFA